MASLGAGHRGLGVPRLPYSPTSHPPLRRESAPRNVTLRNESVKVIPSLARAAVGIQGLEPAGRWSQDRPSMSSSSSSPAGVRFPGQPGTAEGKLQAGHSGGTGGLVRGYYNFTPFKRKTMPGIRGGGERSPGREDVTSARRRPSLGIPRARIARVAGPTPPPPLHPHNLAGGADSTPPPRLPSAPTSRAGLGWGWAAGGAALGLFWASPCSSPRTCWLVLVWLLRRRRGVPRRPRAQRAQLP